MSQNHDVLMKTMGKMFINTLSKKEEEMFSKFFLIDHTGWLWTSAMKYLGNIQASWKHPTSFFALTFLSYIYRIIFLS